MSFILQFFHSPQVDSVASAVDHIDNSNDNDAQFVERFEKFVELITAVYPDLSATDEDGDNEQNLWPEGLDSQYVEAPVVNVAIKTDLVDENILGVIASKAVEAGLLMLDPQNAMLYRTDYVVIDAVGKRKSFGDPAKVASSPAQPVPDPRNPRYVRDAIGKQLRDRLATLGEWSLVTIDTFAVVARTRGDIKQAISISAEMWPDHINIELELWISAEKLSSIWVKALPPVCTTWKSNLDRFCAGTTFDFRYGLTDLVPSSTANEIECIGACSVSTLEEANEFGARLGVFVVEKLLPVIEPIVDLASLATMVFTPDALEIIRSGYVELPEQMASAVLARLAAPQLFEDVAKGLANNPNKAQYWKRFNDSEGKFLEMLIEHLRTMQTS